MRWPNTRGKKEREVALETIVGPRGYGSKGPKEGGKRVEIGSVVGKQ